MTPETRYARTTDGTHVAYQAFGTGPVDIVVMRSWHTNLDNEWTDPILAGILRRLGAIGRVILLDRRGTGLSDRFGRPSRIGSTTSGPSSARSDHRRRYYSA
jgi:pimeloyl-ACP methyl ester carboxylesterase